MAVRRREGGNVQPDLVLVIENLINPPPPATALMTPATMLTIKNKKYVSTIHASILLLMLMLAAVEAGGSPAMSSVSRSRHGCHYRFHGNASRSTLPPVRIMPTRCPATPTFPSLIAPYGTPPGDSTMIFIVSQMLRMAEIIASSLTVTMSST